MATALTEKCKLVAVPFDCYKEEPLSELALNGLAMERMVPPTNVTALEQNPRDWMRPLMARIEGGRVFGLTFIPVNQEGVASLNFFVHNPNSFKKIINGEDPENITVYETELSGRFSGIDDYDSGVLIGNVGNFGHWMLNHFARLALTSLVPATNGIPLIVGEDITKNQLECLALAGFDDSKILRIRRGRIARFRTLWAPIMPFCGLAGEKYLYWAPPAVRFIRHKLGIKENNSGNAGRRIYIGRKGAKWRKLLNEEELLKFIKGKGFEVIDPGSISVAEQISIARSAEVIMGPIGAGMSMIMFAPQGAGVIEFISHKGKMNVSPAIAGALQQRIVQIACRPEIQKGVSPMDADFWVSLENVDQAFNVLGL